MLITVIPSNGDDNSNYKDANDISNTDITTTTTSNFNNIVLIVSMVMRER